MVALTRQAVPLSSLQPVLVAAGTILLIALAVGVVAVRLTTPWDGTEAPNQRSASNVVENEGVPALPISEHSVLLPGERVWAIDGHVMANMARSPFDTRPSAAAYEYMLVSGEDTRVATQPLAPFPMALLLVGDWPSLLTQLVWLAIGAFVFLKRPYDLAAQLLLLLGAIFLPGLFWRWVGVSDIYAGPVLAYTSLIDPLYFLGLTLIVPFALAFPRPAQWARRHAGLLVVLVGAAPVAAIAILVHAHMTGMATFAWMDRLRSLELVTYALVGLSLVVIVPLRYRRLSDPVDRRRLLTVLGTIALVNVVLVAVWVAPAILFGGSLLPWSMAGIIALPIPIAIGVAILRYGAFDIQRMVNRSLVYGGVTAAIALIYVVVVGMAVLNVHEKFGFAAALLVTGVVIVIAQPLRDWLQRSVNRLMYGDRDDPYAGIARLSRRLDSSLAPADVLPIVVQTVADTMRLPYVAIERRVDDRPTIVASRGHPVADPVEVPLVYQGEVVGRMLLAPRAGEQGFSESDDRLLTALATQVSAQVKSVELDEELRRSRERLVAAREEERRQLRRELHDDIGPALAGNLLQLQAARAAIADDPERATEVIAQLERDTRQEIAEIRRIARDLRPPALDDLGLVEALRAQAVNFSVDPGLHVEVSAPNEMPTLPAAVEVAVYRIVAEALANVSRHAGATTCWITLTLGPELVVAVGDDGGGIGKGRAKGVGISSMRERAVELGGSLTVGRRPGGGTLVTARLPLSSPTSATPS